MATTGVAAYADVEHLDLHHTLGAPMFVSLNSRAPLQADGEVRLILRPNLERAAEFFHGRSLG